MKIIKRNGNAENFDKQKIIKVCMAAGLSEKDCTLLADNIGRWLEEHPESQVSSLVIRDKVLLELKTLDPSVASVYEWYEKTKEIPSL